jgi:tetratricopeptide (TPR) repeat protein
MRPLHFAFLAAALFLVMPLCAQAAPQRLSPDARQALSRARTQLERSRPEEAARTVEAYLARTARAKVPPDAYVLLGIARHDAGDVQAALDAFRTGLERAPRNPFLCENAGTLLYEMGRYADAAPLLQRAFDASEKPDPELLYQSAAAWYQAKNYAASVAAVERLTAGAVTLKQPWTELAVYAYLGAGKVDRARAMILRLLDGDAGKAEYWKLLARIELDQEQYARAASVLEVAYRLEPPSKAELRQLAALYRYLEAPLRAAETLERAQSPVPDEKAALELARLYAAGGEEDRALQLLEPFSDSAPVLLAEGGMLFRARRFREAADALDGCLRLEPANGEALLYRGLCAWERREWSRARDYLERAAANKGRYRAQAASATAALRSLEAARLEAQALWAERP